MRLKEVPHRSPKNHTSKEVMLTHEEERSLLFKIAAQVVFSTPPSAKETEESTAAIPVGQINSSAASEGFSFFELLSSPFMLLRGIGSPDLVLDTANAAAESLMKTHVSGALGGFRLFLPPDRILACGGAQSLQVAQWFQEVAVGLKVASASGAKGPATAATAAAASHTSALDTTIEWLRGSGLREVSVRQAVDGHDVLLAALQEESAADPCKGVPLVVMDMPSGSVYGAHVFSWAVQHSSAEISFNLSTLDRVAAFRFQFTLKNADAPCSNVYSPCVGRDQAMDFSGLLGKMMDRKTIFRQTSSVPLSTKSRKESQAQTQEGRGLALVVNNSASSFAARANAADAVKLSNLIDELCRARVSEVIPSQNLSSEFLVNDNLLFRVVQEVLQYTKGCGLPSSTVFLHRCGMHLVLDLIPQPFLPPDGTTKLLYVTSMSNFYRRCETREQSSRLPSNDDDAYQWMSSSVTSSDWIDNVIAKASQFCPGANRNHGNHGPSPSFALNTNDSCVMGQSSCFGESSVKLFMTGSPEWVDVPLPPTLPADAVQGPMPQVWAVQVGKDYGDQTIVPPPQYLSSGVCDLMLAIKAAVVLSPCGAATLAFPYIAQERVNLLKEMDMVQHPLSAAADLGIVHLNRMADDAAFLRRRDLEEKARRCEVKDLGYGSVGPLASVLEGKSALISTETVDPCTIIGVKEDVWMSKTVDRILVTDLSVSMYSDPRSVSEDGSIEGRQMNECTCSLPRRSASRIPSLERSGRSTSSHVQRPLLSRAAGLTRAISTYSSDTSCVSPCDMNAYYSMLGDPTVTTSFADLTNLIPPGPSRSHVDAPHVRLLLLHECEAQNLHQWLVSLNHAVTSVMHPDEVVGFLKCGIDAYDIVIIEWSTTFITQEIQDLLQEAHERNKAIPVVLCLLDHRDATPPTPLNFSESSFPPLPSYVPETCVLRGRDPYYIGFTYRPLLRAYIRLGRLKKDLRGDPSIQYQIRQRIGSGSFGDVYEVSMYASKGRLAMKRIPLGAVTTERMEQLYKEAAIMRELDHRNIVQLSHITCSDNYLQIFMELCDYTLKDVVDYHAVQPWEYQHISSPSSLPLSPFGGYASPFEAALNNMNVKSVSQMLSRGRPNAVVPVDYNINRALLMKDLLSAVHYLHNHDIVHRDLKPQNILFINGVAKLADFGTATTVSAKQSALHTMKGTIPYMAPEVFLGEPYRKPCDIWSLGILIGEILGLRFAHTTLLHYPSLQTYYKSLDEDESMPVVITNFVTSGLQKHFTDDLFESVMEFLQEARRLAIMERGRRNQTPKPHPQTPSLSLASRTVFAIEVSEKEECRMSQHSLPASLVELLESTFYRNPENRATAGELLKHPVASEKPWLGLMIDAVAELNESIANASRTSSQSSLLNFSLSSGGSGEGEPVL